MAIKAVTVGNSYRLRVLRCLRWAGLARARSKSALGVRQDKTRRAGSPQNPGTGKNPGCFVVVVCCGVYKANRQDKGAEGEEHRTLITEVYNIRS